MTAIIHLAVRAQNILFVHWGHFEGVEVMLGIKTESIPNAQSLCPVCKHQSLQPSLSHLLIDYRVL